MAVIGNYDHASSMHGVDVVATIDPFFRLKHNQRLTAFLVLYCRMHVR